MATGYQSYAGYGDPERAKVDRARQLAELLSQGATDTSPKSFWEGAAQLGKAFIARDAMGKADQAESAYANTVNDRNSRLIAALAPDTPAGRGFNPETQDTFETPATPNPNRQILEALMQQGGSIGDVVAMKKAMEPEPKKFTPVQYGNKGLGAFDTESGTMNSLVEPTDQPDASNIRQVGNSIVERQPDGSWKPVYTGANETETARAFQGFIDATTGDQMVVMSNGQARSTGHKAYIPPQMSSVGGVPIAVDKRTLGTTEIVPLTDAAGNKAAMASAEVQGKAQGTAAFNLPAVEQRSQAAINSIADLKRRNIDSRFGLQGKLYAIAGTEGADVQALVRQVTSQAFLNAFDQLRGAGAITETEGKAATAAVTRLQDQNISIGEAIKAMDELSSYYQRGVQTARQLAVKAPVLPERPMSSAGIPSGMVPPLPAPPPQKSFYGAYADKFKSMGAPQPVGALSPEEQRELDALRAELGGQ